MGWLLAHSQSPLVTAGDLLLVIQKRALHGVAARHSCPKQVFEFCVDATVALLQRLFQNDVAETSLKAVEEGTSQRSGVVKGNLPFPVS